MLGALAGFATFRDWEELPGGLVLEMHRRATEGMTLPLEAS
jgi:hypothetical protein